MLLLERSVAVVVFGMVFLLPIFLQNLAGYTTIQTGLLMLPGAVALAISMPIAGRLTQGINTARFTRTLSILAGSGVPVLDSTRIAGEDRPSREGEAAGAVGAGRSQVGVRGAVEFDIGSGQTDVDGIRDYLADACGGPRGWRQRDVISRAEAIGQAVLLVHGLADTRVPPAQSLRLYTRLRSFG